MQFWHARAGMRVCLKPAHGAFCLSGPPVLVLSSLASVVSGSASYGDRNDCCTIAILSQITLRVFISHKQCGHAWFPLSTSDPQANLDVARSSWGCQGGEEKDLSKTLSAVSSKTRAAVRWLLTRLLISTLRCKNRHGFTCVDENISNSWSGHHTRLTHSPLRMYLLICKENKMAK